MARIVVYAYCELYAVRALLETEAARLIPLPIPEASLARLIRIQEQHDEAVLASSPPRMFWANLAFHQALFELTGNETLQRAIAEYVRQTHPIRFSALVTLKRSSRCVHSTSCPRAMPTWLHICITLDNKVNHGLKCYPGLNHAKSSYSGLIFPSRMTFAHLVLSLCSATVASSGVV